MIKLYSQGCPQCRVLKRLLEQHNIEHTSSCSVDDLDMLLSKGFDSLPVLELEDGKLLSFSEAVKWVEDKE